MEKQYSVQFFTSFVESLQELCRTYLIYNEFVEVSGYVCVEMDNLKKERYVLSELLQSSGNVVSESYCTKAFKISRSGNRGGVAERDSQDNRQQSVTNRNIGNLNMQRDREKDILQQSNINRRRSWTESTTSDHQNLPPKVRRSREIIEIIDETDCHPVQRVDRERMQPPAQQYQAASPAGSSAPRPRPPAAGVGPLGQQAHRPPSGQRRTQECHEDASVQRPSNSVPMAYNSVRRHNQDANLFGPVTMKRTCHASPNSNARVQPLNFQNVPSPNSSLSSNLSSALVSSPSPNANLQPGINQFNVQKPQTTSPSGQTVSVQPVNIKSEYAPENQVDYSCNQESEDSVSSLVKSQLQPSSLMPQTSQSGSNRRQSAHPSEGPGKVIKQEPSSPSFTLLPGFSEDEIIDLDLFDDDLVDISPETHDDQTALAREYAVLGSQTPNTIRETAFAPTTQRVISYSVKQFNKFHFEKSRLNVDPFAIAPQQFDQLLLDFYKGVRKANGEDLTARTLKNVQIHLDMYFRDLKYPHSLVKDDLFQASREFVKSKLDKYVSLQKHVAVDGNDIEALFRSGALGCQNPDTLTNTMWFLNTKFFGARRPTDHFNMKWGYVNLKRDDLDQEYLECIVNNSISLKVFAKPDSPSRCFVNFYKQYQCLRPKDSLYEDSPFYLKFHRNTPALGVWFINEPASMSQFQNMWRKLVITAQLPPNKKIM